MTDEQVARNRRSLESLLFERPAAVPRWAVGNVLHPNAALSASVVLVLLVPLLAGLLLFREDLLPWPGIRAGSHVPWLQLLFCVLAALSGLWLDIRLGRRVQEMRQHIRGSDILLRLLEDRRLLADDEQLATRLKQLDYAYLSQDTPFGRARIVGYELAYFLGISRSPGVPTLLSSLALCPLPLVFTVLLLSPQQFGEFSSLRAGLLLATVLSWQWGFAQLLRMTAGLGVLRQHVREQDVHDVEEDEEEAR